MATPTPSEGTQKWRERLQASTAQIQQGVSRVSEPPGAAAARQGAVWAQKVANSRPKWERKVAAVPLGEWQQSMIAGIPRIAEGAERKQNKYENFAAGFYPVAEAVSRQVKGMPKGTLEQSMARVRAAMTTFHQYGQTGRAG